MILKGEGVFHNVVQVGLARCALMHDLLEALTSSIEELELTGCVKNPEDIQKLPGLT